MNLEVLLSKYTKNLQNTIFKEIMHYEILESLFALQDIQNTLVFQGGTALRLCYSGDRYSEDLGFVVREKESFTKEFMEYFGALFKEKILSKYKLEAEIIEPKNNQGTVQRWSAQVYLPHERQKNKINIEIANIPSHNNCLLAVKNNYESFVEKRIFVQVETKEEILADKILAISQRPYLKFRDLWDLEWLNSNRTKINNELISLKITDYKCENFTESLERRKLEIANPKLEKDFLNEMGRFLDEKSFNQVKNLGFFASIQKNIIAQIDEVLEHFSAKQNHKKIHRK